MGLMVRDVASNSSLAQGWSGGIRAGLTTQRPWRSGASAARRDSKGGAPPHSAGYSAKADSNRSRGEAAPWSEERAE